ncbi:VTC domain-containing protein [Cokeromyces recurvatus]|uniref:VTC domain-containing protein n=1 Tax=Cokeromyces recurvatus TaxID=90255 RepID=UPI00221FFA1F|nr:VTC domain-containing protein [Cokeromyces recurvatus]KAI7906037.1 VTC domain-containing protein [Cokeromyces recurvatus]
MKFGAQLQEAIYPEWESYYIDYNILKLKLRKVQQDELFTEKDETEFVELLDNNLEKVNDFHNEQLKRIKKEIDKCTSLISSQNNTNEDDTDELANIQEKINNIADDINRLEKFTRLNYTGFLKIVKKHDRYTNYVLRPMFMVRLNQCPFWKEKESDVFLIQLSSLFSQVRGGGKAMSFQPSTSFLVKENTGLQIGLDTRRTVIKRFFVHTDNILELKTSVLRHLPVLVYRNKDNHHDRQQQQQEQQNIDPPISTLYLDNADMESYCSRVESAPGSDIIRLRWYGSAQGNRSISVERRTLEDENRGEIKDKFTIKDKYVDGFLKGEQRFLEKMIKKMKENGKGEREIESFCQLVKDIQQQIIEHKMQPILRTYYKRTAFQIPGDTSVRMALDTDLCFIREDSGLFSNDDSIVRRPEHHWRRPDVDIDYPFRQLKEPTEVNRFPYATFEIKLDLGQDEDEPEWVKNLEEGGLLEEAYQFSKFVHGIARLFDTRVPLLPYWLARLDDDDDEYKLLPILPSRTPSILSKGSTSIRQQQTLSRTSSATQQMIPTIKPDERTCLLQGNRDRHHYMSLNQEETNRDEEEEERNRDETLWQRWISYLNSHQEEQTSSVVRLPPGVKVPKKVVTPIRVEPKVFFANERTYFSWMGFGTMLSTFSLALFNTGDAVGKISGILYTLIAITTLIYGSGLYYRRRELIRARLPGPYDEMIGPTVICIALLFAVGMNTYLKFTIPESSPFYLFY